MGVGIGTTAPCKRPSSSCACGVVMPRCQTSFGEAVRPAPSAAVPVLGAWLRRAMACMLEKAGTELVVSKQGRARHPARGNCSGATKS